MAHIYVKAGGTATGSGGVYSSQKTGSWSTAFNNTSEYYNAIWDIIGSYPTPQYNMQPGDIIYVSHLHYLNISVSGAGVSNAYMPSSSKLLSVNDSNITSLLEGAWENRDCYWTIPGFSGCYIYGITWMAYEQLYLMSANPFTIWDTCTLSNNLVLGGDNNSTRCYGYNIFKNCKFDNYAILLNSGNAVFINCIFTLLSGSYGYIFRLYNDNYSNDWGVDVHLVGCDFSNCNRPLYSAWVSTTNDIPWNYSNVVIDRCNFHPLPTRAVGFTSTASVTFQDSADTVTYSSHNLPNGSIVSFSSISSTTGISINTNYYTRDTTSNTFKLSLTYDGSVINLVNNGSGTLRISKVTYSSHNILNGSIVSFASITTTTGISINTNYYTRDSSTDFFRLSSTLGGPAITLVNNGTGTIKLTPPVRKAEFSKITNGSMIESAGVSLCETSDVYHYYEGYKYGNICADLEVYRDGGAKINGTTPYSLKLYAKNTISVEGSFINKAKFVKFKLAEFIADFTEFVEFTVEILQPNSSLTLKKSEVWIELFYPDATSSKSNKVTSKEYILSNTLGTAYPFSYESWQGLTGPVKQSITVSTNVVGKEGLCIVWLYCNVPSRFFYICPKYHLKKVT